MSIIKTSNARRGHLDHFQPDNALDPHEQRQLRGHLEQIDYAAFAANKAVLATRPGGLDLGAVQRLAVATAHAREAWIAKALEVAADGHPTRDQIQAVADCRMAFDELCEAYEGLRRIIERGYVGYRAGA